MILCCGEALIDMIPAKTAEGADCMVPTPGGAVFNTAIALGRQSADVGLFTGVSKDLFGTLLADTLTASQVKTHHLAGRDAPTSLAFVALENGQAKYTFYTANAADTTLTAADVPTSDTEFDALFFGGISLCTDPTASTMQQFLAQRSADTVTMMDPNIRQSFITDEASYRARISHMVGHCDIIKVSDEDLAWLVKDADNQAAQAKTLGSKGQLVFVTNGAEGAVAFQNGKALAQVPANKVTVADTVGAGDTFNAGILHSLSQQGKLTKAWCASPDAAGLIQAMGFAAKIAAITVSRQGANPPWTAELA